MSTTDIIVLGATGFTGRLITDYLAHHPQRASFTFGVAGRSQAKLEALKKSLDLNDTIKVVQLDVTNGAQVEEAVKSAQVVINAVGPSIYWGEPVLRACLKHRRQYVDLCGETPWIREMILKYDYVATKAGVLLVPSCGFDSVPADLVVHLASKTLKAALGPRASLGPSLTVYRANGGFSGGTLASLMAIAENVPIEKLQEVQADYALGPAVGKSGVKDRLWYEVPFAVPNRFAMYFFMAPSNRAIVQRSWGLNVTAAAAKASKVSSAAEEDELARSLYGEEFTYDECLEQWPARGVLGWLSVTSASLASAILLVLVVKMKIGFFEITNHSRSVRAPGVPEVCIRTVMHGQGDPGYRLSARMISESALAIVLEKDKLPRMAQEGGILTPATAFGDVLIRRLEACGSFSFESHVITPEESCTLGEEERKQH
ncbi:NAD(P)-binding protein [Fomitopsis serialis]|uniref:NAD(P)-binding protein n=1 Tax=Fomitopsis serialis TaxID=139415 RepID=UPI002007C3D7|nr:NAD(P)-binding protein [Neoantrodia serialis]KAH9934322.1 NAD(P)-binding protein [Neoantrodia serialis]